MSLEVLEDRCVPAVGLESAFFQAAGAIQQSAALGNVLVENAPLILYSPPLQGLVQGVLRQDHAVLGQARQVVQETESANLGPLPTMFLKVVDAQLSFAEYRDSLFAQVLHFDLTTGASSQIPILNQAILFFAQNHLGAEVGGGQCAAFVEEALRIEGGNFIFAQNFNTTDYVWGNLLTQVTAVNGHPVYSNPSAFILPGDIIQYQDVVLSNGQGSFSLAGQHTAIVASVDASGRPTAVYEQNVNGEFYVHLDAIDLSTMTAGTIHVYRPILRQDTAGQVQYSLFNDTQQNQTVIIYSNGFASPQSLPPNGTPGNYIDGYGYGNLAISLGNSAPIAVQNGAGYEVYTTANGQPAIRQV